MGKRLVVFALSGMFLLSCSEKEVPTVIDISRFLDATLINYRSQSFSPPDSLPLNEDLPPGTNLSYTSRTAPVTVNMDYTDIKSTVVSLKMSLEPENFSGAAMVKLYIGAQGYVFLDPTAVTVSDKQILPANFELTSSDPRLNKIFEFDKVSFGMEFILEPSRLQSHQIAIFGHIEEFNVEIKGTREIM
ncbi:MAG TPA: hypothetical protein VM123_16975 [archaeon]|nr:hypothetical protein [archaeon]